MVLCESMINVQEGLGTLSMADRPDGKEEVEACKRRSGKLSQGRRGRIGLNEMWNGRAACEN